MLNSFLVMGHSELAFLALVDTLCLYLRRIQDLMDPGAGFQ